MRWLGKLGSTQSAWPCLLPYSQPIHQTAKSVGMDVEDGSGAVAPADHPAASLKYSQNMLALHCLE
jgi:hypothetical protein